MIDQMLKKLRDSSHNKRLPGNNAANDLVQRTLAQHGLVPSDSDSSHRAVHFSVPAMRPERGASAKTTFGVVSAHNFSIPDGAEFRHSRFDCDAGSRFYRTYIPSSSVDGVTGVVVMLHGCTQSAEDFAIGTGMNLLAEQQRFVVLYPQQSRIENAQSCWNWFGRDDQCRDAGEPAILAGMTRRAVNEFGVSKDRTLVAGLSAGGAMAVIMGETYPDVFSAVGVHSGLPFRAATDVSSAFKAMAGSAVEEERRQPNTTAVRTIIFHGSVDSTVHPRNGERIAKRVLDSCATHTLDTTERGSESGRSFSCRTTTDLNGMTLLEHWSVDGLGHAWSGGHQDGSYTDTMGPDASAEMIRFLYHPTRVDL